MILQNTSIRKLYCIDESFVYPPTVYVGAMCWFQPLDPVSKLRVQTMRGEVWILYL